MPVGCFIVSALGIPTQMRRTVLSRASVAMARASVTVRDNIGLSMGSIKPTKVRTRRWRRWLRWAAAVISLVVAAAGLIVGLAVIADPGWSAPAARSYSNPTATLSIHVNGDPYGAVLTEDSHWMFVSFQGFSQGQPNGVAVFTLITSTSWHMERFITLNPGVGGLALARDDSQLFVADGDAVAVIDVARATSNGSDALLGYLQTGFGAGTFELAVDGDKYLFTADEDTGAVTMFDLARVRSRDLSSRSKLHSIFLGLAVTDVAVGSGGRYLYAVSQLKRPPIDLAPTDLIYGFVTEIGLVHRAGLLDVIDIARWANGQGSPIVAEVLAGCSPVRVIPDEAEVNIWVSARESNEVIGFNLSHLLAGSRAPLAVATVGPSPVGIVLVGGGNYILVVNSNRFGSTTAPQTVTLLHIKAGGGSLSAAAAYQTGGFPREIVVSRSGLTAYVIDNGSSEITVIDLTNLPS